MLSAKQGYCWYHFYNVFGMTRSLTGDWTRYLLHSKPALYHYAIEEADEGLNKNLFFFLKRVMGILVLIPLYFIMDSFK